MEKHDQNSSLHPKPLKPTRPQDQRKQQQLPCLSLRFTPDFTSSRVIRELKLVTCGGSEFVFILNASLPYHMLAACTESLPRPTWELELYIVVCLIMRSASPCFVFFSWFWFLYVRPTLMLSSVYRNSCMFLLVLTTAYLEAQSIWEPFKKRVSVESNSNLETGRPFNLREIVQIHSDSKYVFIYLIFYCFHSFSPYLSPPPGGDCDSVR